MGNKQAFSSNLNVTNVTGLNNPIIMAADEVIMKNIEKDKIDRINNSDNNNNGYTKSAIEVLSINRFTAESYASDIGHKDFSYKFGPKSNNDFKLLFVFFACNFFWTLIMTAIPVLVNLKPQNYYNPKGNLSPTQGTNDWYSSSDVMRLVEPLIGLPFQLILLLCTGMFEQWHNDNFAKALILTWALSAALYETGAGFHSASNMFKNALETYITDDEMKNYDDNLIPLYYYMRTVWEHNYAHYMYASGYAGMQICCCIAYSDKFQDTSSKFDIQTICFLFIAAIIYGYEIYFLFIFYNLRLLYIIIINFCYHY